MEIAYVSPSPATTLTVQADTPTVRPGGQRTLTATVAEQGGNPAFGDLLTFSSSNPGDTIGPVTDNGDGTYTATLTVSNFAGVRTITATDTSVNPTLSGQTQVTVLEAGSLTVTTLSDSSSGGDNQTSLREAIAYAEELGGPQTIAFAPSLFSAGPRTITLAGSELTIGGNVTIPGPGAAILTIDGNSQSRVLHVLAGKTADLSGMTIRGGKTDDLNERSGGAISNRGTLTLTDCVLDGNQAGGTNTGDGGAIFQRGTSLGLVRCLVRNNSTKVGGSGGAIFAGSGTVTLDASIFRANDAAGEGGAIMNRGATITATNCTFSTNIAAFGGAVMQYEGSTTLNFCTVAENGARTTGGGLYRVGITGGTLALNSTLVALNGAPANQGPDVYSLAAGDNGALTSQGHNLIGNGDGGLGFLAGQNSDQVGTTAAPIDPRLLSYSDHGGPMDSYGLMVGSPAIDAGGPTTLTTDGRGVGFPRVIKGLPASAQAVADIGAYELFAAPSVTIPAPLVYNSASGMLDLVALTSPSPTGGSFTGSSAYVGVFDCAAAGVGLHTVTYTIRDGHDALNSVDFTIKVERYRGGAVDDAATNGSGGVILRPLANDTDGVNVLAITSVSDTAIEIGPDGRSLIVPAGYVGSFFYTVNGIYSADVTIAAASGAATIARWEGVITNAGGDVVGAGTVTRSAKGVYSAALRVGTGSATARFTLPGVSPVSVLTKLGDVTFGPHQGSGALLVQMTNNRTGVMRPILKSATAAQYNLAVAGVDGSGIPGGGFLTLTVKSTGAGKLAGTLPDGRGFSANAFQSDENSFAFYGLVNGSPAKGTMGGTLTLANLASTDVTGEFTYALPQQKKGLHVNGVNNFLVANGSAFTKGTLPFASGTIGFRASEGDLATAVAAAVPFSASVPTLSGPFSAWTYNKGTGAFSVKLRTAPAPAPVKTVKGLYLPKSTRAWGFFPGTTVGGRFEAKP